MDNISDNEGPDGSEKIYGNLSLTKKEVQQPKTVRQWSGCLPMISLSLLQLLISLSFFLGIIIVLTQVSRIHQSLQTCTWGNQRSLSSEVGDSWKQMQDNLNKINQLLAHLNVTLESSYWPCPWGWESFQGNCYWFSRSQKDWFYASSACERLKAKLVIINSKDEEQFLQVWDIRHGKRTWIGLTDHHKEGSWEWVDKTPLNDSYWKPGEPNDNLGNEDCVELRDDGWNDIPCTLNIDWICEKPAFP